MVGAWTETSHDFVIKITRKVPSSRPTLLRAANASLVYIPSLFYEYEKDFNYTIIFNHFVGFCR